MKATLSPANLSALAAILAWSTVSTTFKLTLTQLTPLGLLLLSSLAATLFLTAANAVSAPAGAFRGFWRNLLRSLPAGALNPFIYYLMLFVAYNRLRAQEAQVLNYTWAIVLALLSILILKQKFRLRDLLALCLSFFGVMVISTRGKLASLDFSDPLGSGLAVSTSLIWAVYWIINMRDDRPAVLKLMYNFLAGTLLILLYALVANRWEGGLLIRPEASAGLGILGAAYVGIFEMGFTFILWLKALQSGSDTPGVANLIFVTPFISLLFISLVLKESIHPATLVGLLIIIGSNLFQKLPRKA